MCMSTLEKLLIAVVWGVITFLLGYALGGDWLIGVFGVLFCTVVPMALLWDVM